MVLVNTLKMLYGRNKLFFVIAIAVLALFLVGCSSQGAGSAPSGPIGGGCG